MVFESRVTWATSVSILFFLGLSVLDLGPIYATDRQTDIRQHHCFMPPPTTDFYSAVYRCVQVLEILAMRRPAKVRTVNVERPL